MRIFASLSLAAVIAAFAVSCPVRAQDAPPAGNSAPAAPPVGSVPAQAAPASPTDAPPVISASYAVDVDDTISIAVTRHPDVGGSFHIPPDGLLRLQRVITPIDVRGKTCSDLADIVTRELISEGKLVLHPGQVTVSVTGLRIHRIFVRGNAVHGSEYDLKNDWRIDDLVALMGGVPQPDRLTAVITNPQRSAPLPVDLVAALRNPSSASNVALREGDTLTINAPQTKRLLIKGEGPKGIHEMDERFGIRSSLVSLGFTTNGASGDIRHARIIRNAIPGDYSSPVTYIPVDLYKLLSDDSTPEVPFQDLDTLEIPLSDDYVYVFGEITGQRKWYLPQDRKTYLVDVYSNAGDVTANAKMGRVQVTRQLADGTYKSTSYDLGKFLKTGDPRENPLILPHDMIYVPSNNRVDPVNSIWTTWGLFSIAKALVPTL